MASQGTQGKGRREKTDIGPDLGSQPRAEIVIAGLLVLAGAGVLLAAFQQSSGTPSDPLGPRGFPAAIGAALACAGAALFGQTVLASRRRELPTQDPVSLDESDEPDDGPVSPTRLLVISVATLAYVAVLPVAGFLVSTPIALAAIMGLQGGVARRTFVLMMICFPLAIYGLFTLLLGVPLPAGEIFVLRLVSVAGF